MTGRYGLAMVLVAGSAAVVGWPAASSRLRRRRLLGLSTSVGATTGVGPATGAGAVAGRLGGPRLTGRLRAAGRFPAVSRLAAAGRRTGPVTAAAALLTGTAGWVAAGPVAGALLACYAAVAVRVWLRHVAGRAAAAARLRTLDELCALAADLRAGLPPPPEWFEAAERSSAEATAFTRPPDESRVRRLVAAAGRLTERTGAPIADLVDRIEADARALDRARMSALAQAAGARATAWLLATLPAGGIAVGYTIGADPLDVLLHTPLGAACALGGVALQLAGLAWADRLARAGTGALG